MSDFLVDLSERLAATHVSAVIREVPWIVPLVQTIHIIAISIVFSAGLILALSSFNLLRTDWSPARWVRRLNGWFWSSLLVLLLSGTVLVIGEPERSLTSFMFQLKMVLLLVAVAATGVMIRRLRAQDPRVGETVAIADGTTKLLALIGLLMWLGIIAAGRWIAYYVA